MDAQAVVAGFLEGMYYAGKLPSRAETSRITSWLVCRQLRGLDKMQVGKIVLVQMAVLHERVTPNEKGQE